MGYQILFNVRYVIHALTVQSKIKVVKKNSMKAFIKKLLYYRNQMYCYFQNRMFSIGQFRVNTYL